MQITLEKKDKVNASIQVHLQADDYTPQYKSKLKEYSKKVQLNGFRPGHVPTVLVEKMYGKSILVDEVNQIAAQNLYKYIEDNQLSILGDPLPDVEKSSDIHWELKNDFNFYYNIALEPEFNLPKAEKAQIEKYNITFDDKTLNETIENLRSQFGEHVDGDVVAKDAIFHATATEVSTGKSFVSYVPEYRLSEKGKNLFLGATVNQMVTVNIFEMAENDAAIAHILGIKKEEVAALSQEFTFEISKITQSKLAELNEDFYTKVYRGEAISSYEDFCERLKKDIAKNYELESKNAFLNDVFDYYFDNTTIDLPADFLKRWLRLVNDKKLTQEEVEAQYPDFERGLKWDLIKNKVSLENKLKVAHEEVLDKVKKLIYQQFGMGMNGENDKMEEIVTQIAENMLKKDDGKDYRRHANEILGEKVLDALALNVKVKEKNVSPEEFKKIRDNK